jgi:cobalt/nickel transport system ATP-binding protein
MGTLFELSDVGYTYHPGITALQNITLEVNSGEQLVILGANGCGKTTLLQLLGGLIFPTLGAIKAFGKELTEERLEEPRFRAFFRSKAGFIFQNPDVQLFCPTVYEELAFGPLQLDLPREQVKQRVDDLLTMLGISSLQGRAPHQLSGGEKKKVAIAAVLAMNPQLLLLDEPTSALDPRTQSWLQELLSELCRAGKTTVTATHDLGLVESFATRAVVIGEDHRILAVGAPSAILSDTDLLLRANLIRKPANNAAIPAEARHTLQPHLAAPYPFTAACKKRPAP